MALDRIAHDRVIHSSLKEVRRLGTDSDFPAHTPSIGAVIRLNHFNGACLETHTPKLSSLIEGEVFECDMPDLDTELRVRILTLATTCRSLAAELIAHAARLESHAKSELDLIDRPNDGPESPESEIHTPVSGFNGDTNSESQAEPQAKFPSKSRTRTPAPNLSLFD